MSDADSEPSVQEARVIALVSVLDLDNIFVSVAICLIGRGNSPSNTGPEGQQPRSSPNAGRSNMLLVSLFTMSIRLQNRRSNTLYVLEGMFRVPSDGGWWVEEDLNLRPHAYQACALTT